jgi:hypothetical protein
VLDSTSPLSDKVKAAMTYVANYMTDRSERRAA